AASLAGRKSPVAVVLAELRSRFVHGRARLRREAAAFEERAVVVTREEAGLLALTAAGDGKPGLLRLGAGLRLRLLAERKPDAVELARVESGEHVRLVLGRVCAAA